MVEKIGHYSMQNNPTIYDEEALTALELAARTAGKVNECVEEVNLIPEKIAEDVEAHIVNGDFDKQIDKFAGDLSEEINEAERHFVNEMDNMERTLGGRIDNLVGKVTAGSTTMDAEVIDMRSGADGASYASAGTALRTGLARVNQIAQGYVYVGSDADVIIDNGADHTPGEQSVTVTVGGQLVGLFHGIKTGFLWSAISVNIADYITIDDADTVATITIPTQRGVLVFNTVEKQLYIRQGDNLQYGDFSLLGISWGRAVSGALLDTWQRQQVEYAFPEFRRMLEDVASGWMYIGSDADVNITAEQVNGASVTTVYVGNQLVPMFHGQKVGVTWSSISANLGDKIVIDDADVTATITINGSRMALVYNVPEKQLYIRQADNIQYGDFLMLGIGWANVMSGFLFDAWTKTRLRNLESVAGSELMAEQGEAAQTFSARFNGAGTSESFLFFTDPHLAQKGEVWEPMLSEYTKAIADTFHQTPTDFVLCGGDWLGNSDTQAEACYKLGLISARMEKMFGEKYFPVLGNHDTNYQGIKDESAAVNTGTLEQSVLDKLFFRNKGGKAYYSFEGRETRFFVFDTQLDWYPEMDDYKNTQIEWFINQLAANQNEHIALAFHIYFKGWGEDTVYEVLPMGATIMEVAAAFNSRGNYTFNGVSYSFHNCTGKIHFALTGHVHLDSVTIVSDIPVIVTANTRNGGTPTYELCFADYTAGKLYLDRIGNGESRVVDI